MAIITVSIRKSLSFILTFVIVMSFCTTFSLVTSAEDLPPASEYNQTVADYADQIERKFQIIITYPMRSDGYSAIGIGSLSILENSLEYASKDFVKQLSKYYFDNYGNYLTFSFEYMPNNTSEMDPSTLGFFSSSTSVIKLFLPVTGSNVTVSGCSPFTILHELGHSYHLFLSNNYGSEKLKTYWIKSNSSLNYLPTASRNLDKKVFVSVYASRSYEEDFADTFAYVFGCNRPGLGISDRLNNRDGSPTGLGRKVNYIEGSVVQFFDNNTDILNKIQTMRITTNLLKYNNITLSGNSLEYIGFNPPHGVLENVLLRLKIKSVRTLWVYEVGGWKVWDNTGGVYLVFPGATYVTLKIPNKRSAS